MKVTFSRILQNNYVIRLKITYLNFDKNLITQISLLGICSSKEFLCDNQKCISKEFECDMEDTCGDNSDEMNCGKAIMIFFSIRFGFESVYKNLKHNYFIILPFRMLCRLHL